MAKQVIGGRTSRRTFVASAMAGFFVGATRVYGQEVKRDEQKLRVFKVGTGHMGSCDLNQLAKTGDVIVTGLCDVSPKAFPKGMDGDKGFVSLEGVPRFSDYRVMLDKIAAQCDAVCISTPDHTHACIEGRPEACTSRFEYAVHLTQICVLGNIAQRLSGIELKFDPVAKRFDNESANAMLAPAERKGFECFV